MRLTKISIRGGRQKYILVVRTVSGMAMAVAVVIDTMKCREIVGSIAGDGTVMCAVRTAREAHSLMHRLQDLPA